MAISYQRTHNRQSVIKARNRETSTEDRERKREKPRHAVATLRPVSISKETEGTLCKGEGYLGKVVLPLCGGNAEYSYKL